MSDFSSRFSKIFLYKPFSDSYENNNNNNKQSVKSVEPFPNDNFSYIQQLIFIYTDVPI